MFACDQVQLGRWKGALVAVKVVKHSSTEHSLAAQEDFQMEALTLQSLKHPNILVFYGACYSNDSVRQHMCA